jgi:hypothetical protein
VKLYKKECISHHCSYRFLDDPLKTKKTYADYPKKNDPCMADKKCLYCHKPSAEFDGDPVFPPCKWDINRRKWALSRDVFCSRECAKTMTKQRFGSNSWQRIGFLGKFCREFLNLPDSCSGAVPLSARKDFSFYGTMTEEEW